MSKNTLESYQQRILNVLIYIQNNLDGDLSLEKLAQIAHFSPYHFHRIFTAHTNESIKSHIRRLRLERAIRDLSHTNKPIIRVAERAGYDTQQSFHRAFKEAYNMTPKACREKAKADMHHHHMPDKNDNTSNASKTRAVEHHDVDVREIDPIEVAFMRHVGPYTESLQAWLKLIAIIGTAHLTAPDTKKIGIAHDAIESTPSDKIRYDACVTLNENIKPKGNLGIQTLHGGLYAIITHNGPLELIDKTYEYLFRVWLPESGYEPADHPNFMLHRNLPFETPNDQLITEIYLPLKTSK